MKRRFAAVVVLCALALPAAAYVDGPDRLSPAGPLRVGAPTTLDAGQTGGTCDDLACWMMCYRAVVNFPVCVAFRATCNGNTCTCVPACAIPGQDPWHKPAKREMAPTATCDVPPCHP